VNGVTIQRSPAGAGSWSDVCTDTTAAYSCSLDTTTLSDGLYDFRAVAVDNAGTSTTSPLVADRRVDNAAPTSVTMTDPGSPLAGTLTLSGDGSDSGSGMASLKFQYKLTSNSTWLDACTDTGSPYSCTFDTTAIADGDYDFRSLATDNAGNTATSGAHTSRTVNNGGPTVAMTDPGAMRGTVSLGATAADGNGVGSVTLQYSPLGAGTWTDVCTDGSTPYSCSFDTDALPVGLYDFRAVAVDSLGSSSTSAVIGRWIDRTAPSVTMTDPGAYMRASVTLQSTTSDIGSGVVSVLYQKSPAGTNTWTTACTGLATPFSCSFNTATVANGSYDFRAIATDAAGNQTTSAVTAAHTIDNTAPAASNIQAPNGGATANRPDAGDTVVLTSTELLRPQSILSAWDGTSTAVSVRIVNNGGSDEVEVWIGATKANFGLINTREDFITTGYMAFNSSSISQSGSTITVTLGGTAVANGGAAWRAPPGSNSIQWTPSALATDLAGNPMSTTRITELGAGDADF
jgi:Bacterial Ig domain